MAKKNTSELFICDNCGNELSKWAGQCPFCKEWNTIKEVNFKSISYNDRADSSKPVDLYTPTQALDQLAKQAAPTNISELDRVLGTGLTPGGVYLLAGQPGIGKSTLLTQLAINLSQNSSVLYLCSEENAAQVSQRILRLKKPKHQTDGVKLLSTDLVEDLITHISRSKDVPAIIIVDSIQSVSSTQVTAIAGTLSQIRATSNLLIHLAKTTQIPVVIVGHVTKTGNIAGPKLLEHMVDVVLELEGDRHHDLRLLRGVKNRFGPTDETGIFQMTGEGLSAIKDPSQLFLSDRVENAPGSALGLIMEGTRPLIIEVQALTVSTELAIPRRVSQGVPPARLQLITAVLTKHLNLKLGQQDVFVNVTGGLAIREPAADLAIALAILSSYQNKPIPPNQVAIGELGLLGEIRSVPYLEKRLKEAKNLGYHTSYTPKTYKTLKQINLK